MFLAIRSIPAALLRLWRILLPQ